MPLSTERIIGRIARITMASRKDTLPSARLKEYEGGLDKWKALLAANVGPKEAEKMFKAIQKPGEAEKVQEALLAKDRPVEG